jgi:hypothetical protein
MSTTYTRPAVASPEWPNGRVEKLRHILEVNQHRSVSYQEAKEVGESLITFFELLAEDNGELS